MCIYPISRAIILLHSVAERTKTPANIRLFERPAIDILQGHILKILMPKSLFAKVFGLQKNGDTGAGTSKPKV
jgi:hypothetical protein